MKIRNFRHVTNDAKSRISADLQWEDCDRPDLNLFFETDEEFGQSLASGLEAFLVGTMLPAMHHGEKRIHVEGTVCPELSKNLKTAMIWVRRWYYEPSKPLVSIEASKWSPGHKPSIADRSGFFLSGGIDCLALLQSNHAAYPQDHPAAIRDGLLIFGQNIESDVRPEIFQQACADLSRAASEKNVVLIPVHTNIRLVDDGSLMFDINHGAILGAVAHAFAGRLTRVYVSASDSIPGLSLVDQHNFKPHGSHPLLDPLYSSYHLTIKHDGISQSRFDKVLTISDWPSGLQVIRVCGSNWPGENCCKCEKCVRTMLELLAAGVLHKTQAFSVDDVTTDMISRIKIKKPTFGYSVNDDYLELIGPLERMGRHDLSRAILEMIDRSFYPQQNLRQKIQRFDAKYLDGSIARIKKIIKRTVTAA